MLRQRIHVIHTDRIGGSAKSATRLPLNEKNSILKYTKYILTIENCGNDVILLPHDKNHNKTRKS